MIAFKREMAYRFRDSMNRLFKVQHAPGFEETIERLSYSLQANFGMPEYSLVDVSTLDKLEAHFNIDHLRQGGPSKKADE